MIVQNSSFSVLRCCARSVNRICGVIIGQAFPMPCGSFSHPLYTLWAYFLEHAASLDELIARSHSRGDFRTIRNKVCDFALQKCCLCEGGLFKMIVCSFCNTLEHFLDWAILLGDDTSEDYWWHGVGIRNNGINAKMWLEADTFCSAAEKVSGSCNVVKRVLLAAPK